MKRTTRFLATLVLITGLMAPTAMQANGFFDNFLGWFSTAAGASAGAEVGRAAGRGVSHHVGEMIPNNLKKPLIVIGAIGLVAYLMYRSRDESAHHHHPRKIRARACANKGCSHKKCK